MRHKMFSFAALSLVAVLLLVGLAGCQREASVRVTSGAPSVAGATGATTQGTVVPTAVGGGLISPVGGATVISALTPGPNSASATQEPATTGSITPTLVLPTPVVVQPVATQKPTGTGAQYTLYTVKAGDTLYSIAVSFGTTVAEIAAANNIADPSTIVLGQVLKIPTGDTTSPEPGSGECRYHHTVKPGEWIWQIARNYGVDPYAILRANGLTVQTGSNISAGDRLCIP